MMDFYETKLSSQQVFEGRVVSVSTDRVRLPDGRETGRELVSHSGGVCILAIEDENILMVRQFRYPFHTTLLELPAGKIEKGEAPADCGRRELREETGFEAKAFEPFGILYPSPGYLSEVIHLYTARQLNFVGQRLDPGEFLQVERIPFPKAVQMVLSGELPDAKTQAALLKYTVVHNLG